MNIKKFFKQTNLDDSLLLGYYGGTNFGDELLLEIVQSALHKNQYKNITIRYTRPDLYDMYHKDYGYKMIDTSIFSLIKTLFKTKNIIVGGGGFWGLDFNRGTFLMGVVLFIARFFLFKRVYLIGVGYYNSATTFGRFGAWIAGSAATMIIARDDETYNNFKKTLFKSKNKLYLDKDIAFYIDDLVDMDNYKNELISFTKKMSPYIKSELIGVRRFDNNAKLEKSIDIINGALKDTAKKKVICLFEYKQLFQSEYKDLFSKIDIDSNTVVIDFDYNPILLYLWMKDAKNLSLITFQFHVIMVAYLAGVKFTPLAYDNKVVELFNILNIKKNEVIKLDI